MNQQNFENWLENYKNAWENKNPNEAAKLFSVDATYRETPFDEPMRGRGAIVEYWKEVENSQKDIVFDYEVLAVDREKGIAHWKASFKRMENEQLIKLDGILIAYFNEENECTKFEEWWHTPQ